MAFVINYKVKNLKRSFYVIISKFGEICQKLGLFHITLNMSEKMLMFVFLFWMVSFLNALLITGFHIITI